MRKFRNSLLIVIILAVASLILTRCTKHVSNRLAYVPVLIHSPEHHNSRQVNFLRDYQALYQDGDVNVVIEIPAGTLEKWELDKASGIPALEYREGMPRIIQYLGYPGNYGIIPRTLSAKEYGGDGDPLDVIVLGHPLQRSSVAKCKLIGVLYLLDQGEQDDKLIAVAEGHTLYDISDITELDEVYPGISQILDIWFSNYKGPGVMKSKGFGDRKDANSILSSAMTQYQENEKNGKF